MANRFKVDCRQYPSDQDCTVTISGALEEAVELGWLHAKMHHAHKDEDKTYYVLEGYGSFVVGDEMQEHGPHHAVFAPAELPHGVKNTSNGRLTLLVFMTPNPNTVPRA